MDLGIDGKVALVTAASRGLGRGAALALSREGARLAICARDPERLAATAAELPGEVLAIPADVTDPEAPARLVAATVERFGSLDILVANAGGPPPSRALDVVDDALLAALNANLLTSIRLVQAAVPHMRAAGWGRICLHHLVLRQAADPDARLLEHRAHRPVGLGEDGGAGSDGEGITLNLACPGLHATDRMKELGITGPAGDPEDFGRVVAFLCSDAAGFVSGAALQVDGAATLGLL